MKTSHLNQPLLALLAIACSASSGLAEPDLTAEVTPRAAAAKKNSPLQISLTPVPVEEVRRAEPATRSSQPTGPDLVPQTNAAGFSLYRALVQDGQFLPADGNLALSPASLEPILLALRLAAHGTTAAELDLLLQTKTQVGNGSDSSALMAGNSAALRQAATLWLAEGWEAKPDYLATLKTRLGVEPQWTSFAKNSAAATRHINRWIKDQTSGRITQLFQPADLDAETRLVLVSALAYDGEWDHPFKQEFTQLGPFQTSQHGLPITVQTPLMRQLSNFATSHTQDGTRVVALPLSGGAQRCVLLLPAPGKDSLRGLTALEKSLTPKRYRDLTRSLQKRSMDLKLPRLDLTVRSSIKAALQRLGVRTLFDPRAANLSGINDESGLCVSVLRHETKLELDEFGVRGAAATGAAIAARGLPPKPLAVTFNRPFLFAIEDTTSGQVLFLGRLVTPDSVAGLPKGLGFTEELWRRSIR
jgi:serpin B